MDEATDDRLMAAMGRDRGRAIAILVARYSPVLYPTARRLAGSDATAEDLLQETWLRLMRRPPRLAPGQGALPWLRRVLVHLAVDQARSRTRRRTDPDGLAPAVGRADPGAPPEAAALSADERRRVRLALSRLPPGYGAILVLLHGEGWSVREVAAALGLPATMVKNRALRGRRRLRQLLLDDAPTEVENDVQPPAPTRAKERGRPSQG